MVQLYILKKQRKPQRDVVHQLQQERIRKLDMHLHFFRFTDAITH